MVQKRDFSDSASFSILWNRSLLWLMILLNFATIPSYGGEPLSVVEPSQAIVARYGDGTVTEDELAAWQDYLRRVKRKANREPAIEDLVVVRVLASRFPDSEEEQKKLAAGMRAHRRSIAREAVQRTLLDQITVTEEELRHLYDSEPNQRKQAPRWRLSNIFRRTDDSSDANLDQARGELASLRVQVLNGASFSDLAEQHSDSQTRLRGGDLGYVSLDRLDPAVAEVVSQMEEGDLSLPIRTSAGMTLLKCTARLPGRVVPFEEVKSRLSNRFRKEKFEQAINEIESRLLRSMNPTLLPEVSNVGPSSIVGILGTKSSRRGVSTDELFRSSAVQGKPSSYDEFTRKEQKSLLDQLALLLGYEEEADRRGLLDDEGAAIELRFRDLEYKAQLAANFLTEGALETPSLDLLKQRFQRRQEAWVSPEKWWLRAIVVPKQSRLGREYLEGLRRQGDQLVARGGDFEEVAVSLAPHGTTIDYGWLTADQIWTLGKNIEYAVKKLNPGLWSPLVQQNNQLFLFQLRDKREERPLTFEEARLNLEAADLAAQRRRFGKSLRAEILAEQKIEMIGGGSDL